MARPLRIEFENAYYHVMNRGADRKNIYKNDFHKQLFIELLDEANKLFEIEIHAYCLMDNHYHLLVKTPKPNLSRAMRHINGIYTQRFNKDEKKDGPLFRGRYKSIVVSFDGYFLNVSRYIHLNPVSAKIVSSPEQFPWSSYSYFIDSKNKPSWLKVEETLEMLENQNYFQFINEGIDDETYNFYENKKTVIFGPVNFRDTLLKQVVDQQQSESKADVKRIKRLITFEQIVNFCSQYFNIDEKELLNAIRGKNNFPRKIAIYFCRLLLCATFTEIAKYFRFHSHSHVSGIIRDIETAAEKEPAFKDLINELHMKIVNSQTKI